MPLTPSKTRQVLEALGHHPRKKLGQNFLVDGNIVRKSLDLAGVAYGDAVVEVGPGIGTLTSALLEAGAGVYAVELDKTLHAYLTSEAFHDRFSPEQLERFNLLHADALDAPIASLPDAVAEDGKYKIVANLPYAISTPWLDAVLSGPLPQSMTLMLQKEAADRFTAKAGSKSFGSIAILLQAAYTPVAQHKVGAQCFYPAPDVGSALLHIERKAEPIIFPSEKKVLIRRLFNQRRKQIGAVLKQLDDGAEWLQRFEANGTAATTRPEDVPLEKWIKL